MWLQHEWNVFDVSVASETRLNLGVYRLLKQERRQSNDVVTPLTADLIAEEGHDTSDRVGGRLAQAADRGVLHGIAQLSKQRLVP